MEARVDDEDDDVPLGIVDKESLIIFTAILVPSSREPRYTIPNPPLPITLLKLFVMLETSSYVNLLFPEGNRNGPGPALSLNLLFPEGGIGPGPASAPETKHWFFFFQQKTDFKFCKGEVKIPKRLTSFSLP